MHYPFKNKYILIINDNGLGDYFLVRDYFKYIKQSEKYKNQKIIFLAKPDRIDCVKHYDKKYIDKIIEFNTELFERDENYRKRILKRILKHNITDIINTGVSFPLFDNEPYSTVKLCTEIPAENKIAHIIEPQDSALLEKYIHYTNLICTPHKNIFEYERNRLFFEQFLKIKIPPQNKIPKLLLRTKKNPELILICPFKRCVKTIWDAKNWADLINKIAKDNPDFEFVITGTKSDKESANDILNAIDVKVKAKNLAGKIKSSKLAEVISSSQYVISSETSTVHIAAMTETKTLCISNGNFYKRFQPIPSDNVTYVYPDDFDAEKESLDGENLNKYYYTTPYKTEDISVEKVYKAFKKMTEK